MASDIPRVYAFRGARFKSVRGLRAAVRKHFPGKVFVGWREAYVTYGDGSTAVFDVTRERNVMAFNGVARAYVLVTILDSPHTTFAG